MMLIKIVEKRKQDLKSLAYKQRLWREDLMLPRNFFQVLGVSKFVGAKIGKI
jgi:hypothetical protein